MIIEVCANSYESAINAEQGGADRIELCKDLHLDGLTPAYEIAKKTIDKLKIPVFILIRPREGDFDYSNEEFELMKADIMKFKEMGCKGIVCGILNDDKTIDLNRTSELVKLSKPLEFTFHRAFDKLKNLEKGIKELIGIGVKRILTSGKHQKAIKSIKNLEKYKNISENEVVIMPGGSINKIDLKFFKKKGFKEVHGTFKNDFII
jgi:copper homeostasis protein